MRFVRLVGIAAALIGLAVVSTPASAQDETTTTVAPPAPPPPTVPTSTDTVEVRPDIPYYDGGPVLDAYLPKDGQTKRTALVLVHGGGWNSGDKAEFAPYAMQAANDQRWAVFDVDYLLSPTDPTSWPDELHDIQAAIRFIAANAQTFGIDPQRVIALGESAGANLLALIASKGTANPVTGDPVGANPTLAVPLRGVGLWSPPVDLADLYANAGQAPAGCGADRACGFVWSQGAVAQYMKCDPTSCPQAYADASPTNWVSSGTAPSYVVNSTNELVPLAQVVQYVQKLQAARVNVQYAQLDGTSHGIQYVTQMWGPTLTFLAGVVDPPPPPPDTSTTVPATSDTTAAVDSSETAAPDAGSSSGSWPIVVIVAVLAVVVAAVVLTRLRRHANRSDTIDLRDQPDVNG
jgi:acetyl esterase/lipase